MVLGATIALWLALVTACLHVLRGDKARRSVGPALADLPLTPASLAQEARSLLNPKTPSRRRTHDGRKISLVVLYCILPSRTFSRLDAPVPAPSICPHVSLCPHLCTPSVSYPMHTRSSALTGPIIKSDVRSLLATAISSRIPAHAYLHAGSNIAQPEKYGRGEGIDTRDVSSAVGFGVDQILPRRRGVACESDGFRAGCLALRLVAGWCLWE